MEKCLILLALKERPMRDHVDAFSKPRADKLAKDDLRLLEPFPREIGEAADRFDDIIKVQNRDHTAGIAKPGAEGGRDCALS